MAAALAQGFVRGAGGEQCGDDAKINASEEGEAERERHHRQVKRDLVEARNRDAVGHEREQAAVEREREQQPSYRAQQRKKHALAQQLPHQAAAFRAERRAQAELLLADRAARQQQVGDVHTGDEQDQRHGSGQDLEGRANLVDHLLVDRHERHRPAAVAGRKFVGERGGDGLHVARRLLEGHAVAKPRQTEGRASSGRGPQLLHGPAVRHQEGRSLPHQRETWRHDADNHARLAVGHDGRAEDVGAAAEPGLPELVGDHEDLIVAVEVLIFGISTAHRRLHAEDREHVRGGQQSGDLFRTAVDREA